MEIGLLAVVNSQRKFNYDEGKHEYRHLKLMTVLICVTVGFYIYGILFYYGCIKKGLIIRPDFVPE